MDERKFRLPSKPTPRVGMTKTVTVKQAVEEQLRLFELAVAKEMEIRGTYAKVFMALEELEKAKNDSREAVKRLLYTKSGPPPEVGDRTTHVWAKGEHFEVETQYKKKSDYYNPALLDGVILAMPDVVTEVNKTRVDAIQQELLRNGNEGAAARIARALTVGEFMTPSVSIKRL